MMIKMCLVFSLLITVTFSARSQGRVDVNVNNFENNKGSCIVCLYNNANDFANSGKPVQCTTTTVSNKVTKAHFANVSPGTYAILVIHDGNNNQKFDTNFFGIPKEGYGASQNKLPFAAAPKFDDNKFDVVDGATVPVNIKLRYIF